MAKKHPNHHLHLIALYTTFVLPMALVGYLSTKNIHAASLPSGKIKLTAASQIALGEKVGFAVTNDTDSTIYIENHCPSEPLSVYKWENNGWQPQHATNSTKVCKVEERKIAIKPHETAAAAYNSWPELFSQRGTYRINAQVEGYDQVLSHDIVVK